MYILYNVHTEGGEIVSPKVGRPTDNPKNNRVNFRLSDEDIEMLEQCSNISGKSKTEIVRQGIREVYEKIKK